MVGFVLFIIIPLFIPPSTPSTKLLSWVSMFRSFLWAIDTPLVQRIVLRIPHRIASNILFYDDSEEPKFRIDSKFMFLFDGIYCISAINCKYPITKNSVKKRDNDLYLKMRNIKLVLAALKVHNWLKRNFWNMSLQRRWKLMIVFLVNWLNDFWICSA